MVVLLLLASLPAVLSSSSAAAPDVQDQIIRASKNGEFVATHYPARALKAGEQGKVGFRLTIEPDGSLGACDVTESSGFRSLDTETCELLLRYARLQPIRDVDGRKIRSTQFGFLVWRLPAGTVKVATATSKTMPKPDQIICKRTQTTGSLVSKTKQCLTRNEWSRAQTITRDDVERIQGRAWYKEGDPSNAVACGLSCF